MQKRGKCIKFDRKKCGKHRCPKVVCAKGFYKRHFHNTCCARCLKCKCSRYFDPVCSVLGVTFRNACDAKCSHQKIKHKGACNRKCDGRCPSFIKPVCGKDKKTYRNRCVLRSNLVQFAHNGRCGRRHVKDPKDHIKKHKPKVHKKIWNGSLCDKMIAHKRRKLRKNVVKFTHIKGQVQKLSINAMAKLRRRINKQSSKLVKLIIACKRHRIPKHLITEWHMRKYRFKKDWWYIRGDLINESFNIKTKKINRLNQRFSNCQKKLGMVKAKWVRYYGYQRRLHIQKINKVRSIRLRKYLRRQYKIQSRLFRIRLKRKIFRIKRRCMRIVKHRRRYISRFNKIIRIKRRIKSQKHMKKFIVHLKHRKIIRRRKQCIHRYSRANERLKAFRQRKISQINNTKRRRVGVEKRLKKYCRFTKNKKCFDERIKKLVAKWAKVDAKRELKRNKVIEKLTKRIQFLEKTCNNLHKLATPLIKRRNFLKNLKITDIKICSRSHILIKFLRNQVKYRIKKKQSDSCLANINARFTKVKSMFDIKKIKCKTHKCTKNLRRRLNKFKRMEKRKLRRCVRNIRRNLRHYQKRRRDLINRLKAQIDLEKSIKKCKTLKFGRRKKCFAKLRRIASIRAKKLKLQRMHRKEKKLANLKSKERRHLARQKRNDKKRYRRNLKKI